MRWLRRRQAGTRDRPAGRMQAGAADRAPVEAGYRDLDEKLWEVHRPYREDERAANEQLRERLFAIHRDMQAAGGSSRRHPAAWLRWSVGAIAVALVAVTAVLAAGNVVNLGKPGPEQLLNPYFPLSGFHRIKTVMRSGGKPVLLYVGTNVDQVSAAERWPLVKALQQFGTLSGVKPATSSFPKIPGTALIATLDITHARYRSRYLVFEHVDLLGSDPHRMPLQPLRGEAKTLYDRYAREPRALVASGGKPVHDPDHVLATLFNREMPTSRKLPMLSAGGYLQTVSQLIQVADFEQLSLVMPGVESSPTRSVPYSFSTVQHALLTGRDPGQSRLVEDVDGEANVLIALVCHADGKQPASVCGLPAIRAILKHVK